ncbi:MAG: FkbM family methyltransferase [bacterium]
MRNPLLRFLKESALAVSGHGLGRIKPLRWLYDHLYQWLKPRQVWVQGHRMVLDDQDSLELATREIYEPLETRLLLENLRPGQTFLDIGANIGYYTLLAARQVGPQGKVFAFEPDPENFRILKTNVEFNGYSNATLLPQAVSAQSGEARLYLNPRNRGDHRLYDSKDNRSSLPIAQVALDDVFKELETIPHFIKMDIQGAEAGALAGMKKLLSRCARVILISEFGPEGLRRFGADPQIFLRDLTELGFKIREIDEASATLLDTDLNELSRRFPPGNEGYTNLFCEKD